MTSQRGQAVAEDLSKAGAPSVFVAADLADAAAPAALVQACLDRFGRIDGLVNAAGLTDRASFLDGDLDDWERLFAVNARAPFFLMQAAIAAMRQRGEGGAIVNIQSINAHCGTPELAVYSASKGALATLTRNAANAHRFDRIRVNGINVGWTDTPAERIMQGETLGHGSGWIDEAAASSPVRSPVLGRGRRQACRFPAFGCRRPDDGRPDRPGAVGGGSEPVNAPAAVTERLGQSMLGRLPAGVEGPAYDRARLAAGMAHIGVGAFHRCHQAEYTDDLLAQRFDRWGVIGINVRPPRPRDNARQPGWPLHAADPRGHAGRGARHRQHCLRRRQPGQSRAGA